MRNIRQIQGQFHLNFRDGITREVDNSDIIIHQYL